MSHTEARAIPQAPSFIRAAVTATSVLLLLAVLGIVLFTMLRSPLKDDIAWLLYVARRWLAGRELYVDVVEVNPPLIVWISAIPLQLANALGIDAQYTAIPFFVAGVLACAWWTAVLLQGSFLLLQKLVQFAQRLAARRSQARLFLGSLPVHLDRGDAVGHFVTCDSCAHADTSLSFL